MKVRKGIEKRSYCTCKDDIINFKDKSERREKVVSNI